MENLSALSVRQPYAELIMRGQKKFEYRSVATRKKNERVYIYASKTPGDAHDFRRLKMQPGDLPTGVLIGTVEIVDCTGRPGDYKWRLANPERLPDLIKPHNHPQPIWFKPF